MNKRLRRLAALALLCVLPAWAAAASSPAPGPAAQASAATQPLTAPERAALTPSHKLLETGGNVANTNCAGCHGLDGVSTAPGVPHLAGQRTTYLNRVLKSYQSRDRRSDEMSHATDFLNDEALTAVSAYYASLPPAPPVVVPGGSGQGNGNGDPFAGIREDMKKCVKCHGEDGNASASGMPNLTAQSPDYFVESMKAYVDGGRDHRLMKKMLEGLDDETLLTMGTFYAVQQPRKTETTGSGNADLGRALSESCGNCHGVDGNAAGPSMPSLSGQDARYFVKAMEAYKNGKRQHDQMFQAVDPLSEDDIANLAAFYAGQDPVRRNVRTPLSTDEWIVRCERCHGIDGNSSDPRFPMLAGQEPTYLENALQSYTGTTRSNSIMHAMAEPPSASDISHIIEYFSTRKPKAVIYMQLPCEDP
jgi:cytochrome c553